MIKHEFLYKLNLPLCEDVLISPNILDNFKNQVDRGSKIFYPDPKDIFKKQWLVYKNLDWNYCSLFVRHGYQNSIIHRDNPFNKESLHWGINWVIGSCGYMDYWDESQIEEEEIIVDTGGEKTVFLKTNLSPIKSYRTDSGAYLVNASVPHRVRNPSDETRIALSLRSKKFRYENPSLSWDSVIKIFDREILTS
jgi:hypothetical protein